LVEGSRRKANTTHRIEAAFRNAASSKKGQPNRLPFLFSALFFVGRGFNRDIKLGGAPPHLRAGFTCAPAPNAQTACLPHAGVVIPSEAGQIFLPSSFPTKKLAGAVDESLFALVDTSPMQLGLS